MLNNGISLHAIENKQGIDRHTLRNWRDQKNNLNLLNNKDNKFRKNKKGGVIKNSQEEEICNFINNARKNSLPVSTKSVICYASKINFEISKKKP